MLAHKSKLNHKKTKEMFEKTTPESSPPVLKGFPQSIFQLQQTIGNKSVAQLLMPRKEEREREPKQNNPSDLLSSLRARFRDDSTSRVQQRDDSLIKNGEAVIPPKNDPSRSMVLPGLPKPYINRKKAKQMSQEYWRRLEEYYDTWGYWPWEAWKRRRQSEYVYEPDPKQVEEDRREFIKAKKLLAREKEYLDATRHGGFESRAAAAVGKVKRDKPERVINYGEATYQWTDEEFPDFVIIDYEKFGPYISGSAGRDQTESGPYSVANPDCADPQVQDAVREWCAKEKQKGIHIGPDSVNIQHYDDKPPCETCEHNLTQQATQENSEIDLFLPTRSDVAKGKYEGAKYEKTYKPSFKTPQPLKRRGRGKDKEQILRELNLKKTAKSKELDRANSSLEKLQKNEKFKLSNAEAFRKSVEESEKKIAELNTQLQKLDEKIKDVQSWPDSK